MRGVVVAVVLLVTGCGAPVPPPLDAGAVDGSVPDSGSDSGVFDAGALDSGVADSGPDDAGTPDAGPDAGTPDAGLADSGAVDSGSGDAGFDAGEPDAGSQILTPRDAGAVLLDSGLPWSWASVADVIGTPPSNSGVTARWVNIPSAAYRAWAGGVLLPDGGIVGIPFNEPTVLVIHATDDTSERWPITGGGFPEGWEGGALLPDGIVIGIPRDAPRFLRIDPAAGTATLFGDDLSDAGVDKFRGGVLGLNGQVYAAPFEADFIARLDPATGRVTKLPVPLPYLRGLTNGAVLFPTGDIVMFPARGTPGLLIVPARDGGQDEVWLLPTPAVSGSAAFAGGGVIAGVEVALAPPQQNALPLGYGAGLLAWSPAVTGLTQMSSNSFSFGAWSTDGHWYAPPYGAQEAMRFTVAADSGVLFEFDAGVLTFGAVLGAVGLPDGRIICIPHAGSQWLELTPAGCRTVPMEAMTSPFLNKL